MDAYAKNVTPFEFGVQVSGETFTDRAEETRHLCANFQHGINTILISPRRMGKTSLVDTVIGLSESESPDLMPSNAPMLKNSSTLLRRRFVPLQPNGNSGCFFLNKKNLERFQLGNSASVALAKKSLIAKDLVTIEDNGRLSLSIRSSIFGSIRGSGTCDDDVCGVASAEDTAEALFEPVLNFFSAGNAA